MKIHKCTQGEYEWLKLRVGKVTASEMDRLLTPQFKTKEGEGPNTYLCEKLAEAYRGEPLPGFTSFATEQGKELEDEARRWYAFSHDEALHNVGFCEHDDGRSGCSPDALIGEDGGLELKCPEAHTHVKYLLSGELPKDYATQVYGSMFVTGRKWWKFVSYRRGFPALILTIQRDEAIMAKIQSALATFCTAFDAGLSKLKAL